MSTPRFGIIARRMHLQTLVLAPSPLRLERQETGQTGVGWYKGAVGHSRHDIDWD